MINHTRNSRRTIDIQGGGKWMVVYKSISDPIRWSQSCEIWKRRMEDSCIRQTTMAPSHVMMINCYPHTTVTTANHSCALRNHWTKTIIARGPSLTNIFLLHTYCARYQLGPVFAAARKSVPFLITHSLACGSQNFKITKPWSMEPGGSMPHLQGSPIIPNLSRITSFLRIDTDLFKIHSNTVLPFTHRPY